jgi:PKD repeat protein
MSFFLCGTVLAYQVPYDYSDVKYFYVFGPEGDKLMGAEDSEQVLIIDVPAAEPGKVTIGVYDPDTGGKEDWRIPFNEWNTTCEFAVYGNKMLDKQVFGQDDTYDQQIYTFGPYDKTQGEKIGALYRFKLVVKGLKGDDQNMFKVMISPEGAESFVENITFRLLHHEGDKMYFYPEVLAGTKHIVIENYDLDKKGGSSTLQVNALSTKMRINDSKSGEWSQTVIPIETETSGRMVYIITKGTQRYANAGLRIKDDKGNPVALYFREGRPPVSKVAVSVPVQQQETAVPDIKCNKFTFDATSSYDIDKQTLTYLWDFGDGETSTEPVVTHIYDKGGKYTVSLTVKDDSGLPCDNATTTQTIYVNTPPEAAFSGPELVCKNDTVTFDASATKDDTPDKISYIWNFGDGDRAEGKRVTHKYSKGGVYDVSLMVDDNANTECSVDSVQKRIKVNSAPVAAAGRDVTMCLDSINTDYTVAFDGSQSKDPDGDALEYTWDFGDGVTASGAEVTHTYKKGGEYKVTLTVNDSSGLACSSDSDTLNVELNKTPVAEAGLDKKICTGQSVSFDGSGSKTEPGESLSYKWSFGDGTEASGAKVSHTFKKGGKYMVLLTVDDGRGTPCSSSTDIITVDVNSRPVAELEEVEHICAGKKVYFDASGSNDADGDSLDYSWNFGDGNTAQGSSRINHSYSKGGVYNVSVTVDDGKDSPCSASSDAIKVKVNTPPKAVMDIERACCVDLQQKFTAVASSDADGDALSYLWDFGDGSTGSGATVSHIYTEPGTYKVVLTVNDGSGTECAGDSVSEYITVNAKPVPVIKIK